MSQHMFWMAAVPGETKGTSDERQLKPGQRAALDKANGTCQGYGSPCSDFDIPAGMKVGTLDALMLMSDELDKFDKHADNAMRRIVRAWQNDLSDDGTPLATSLLKVETNSGQVEIVNALQQFSWKEDRFPHKDPLPQMTAEINKSICELDDEVKEVLGKLGQLRNQSNALKRKTGGNLIVKDLNGVIKPQHYVRHPDNTFSEKIVPVFIVVPIQKKDEFFAAYESFSKEVLPGSWQLIQEDDSGSYMLGRVLHLDCPTLQSFKTKVSDAKCTIRDFTYDCQAEDDMKHENERLKGEEQEAKDHAKQTLQMAFSEVFICHMHLKAVRLFVESVLWYGLPVNFQAMVVQVNNRKESNLKAALDKQFANAKGTGGAGSKSADDAENEESPYVKFEYDLDFMYAGGD